MHRKETPKMQTSTIVFIASCLSIFVGLVFIVGAVVAYNKVTDSPPTLFVNADVAACGSHTS